MRTMNERPAGDAGKQAQAAACTTNWQDWLATVSAMSEYEYPGGYLFYDTETSGLDTRSDQILQAALVRLDADLTLANEAEDVAILRCDLAEGVVPSPTALLATRVWPKQLSGQGLTAIELLDRVAETVRRWREPRAGAGLVSSTRPAAPLVFAGHNILRYDEELLRHGLWRALRPPYLTQQEGSTRLDTLLLAQAAHMLTPGAIAVPNVEDEVSGEPRLSFRLGDLCRANGIKLDEAAAHDAAADVMATIELARLVRIRAPAVFALALRNGRKAALLDTVRVNWRDLSGLERVGTGQPSGGPGIVVTSGQATGATPMTPYVLCTMRKGVPTAHAVLPLGVAPGHPTMLVALDLAVDPSSYAGLPEADLMCLAKSPGSPFVTIRLNRQPCLLPVNLTMSNLPPVLAALISRIASDGGNGSTAQGILKNRMQRLRRTEEQQPGSLARWLTAVAAAQPVWPPPAFAEDALYAGGFPSRADDHLRDQMRDMSPAAFVAAIPQLADAHLQEWARRRAYAVFPEALPETDRAAIARLHASRVLAPAGGRFRSAEDALAELWPLIERHFESPPAVHAHLQAIMEHVYSLREGAQATLAALDADDMA